MSEEHSSEECGANEVDSAYGTHVARDEQGASDTHNPAAVSLVERIARREDAYPPLLRELPGAPQALYAAGGRERLLELLGERAVAIVGSPRASDYGMETARSLARALAASGVTVVGALAEGVAAAAHMGALEGGGRLVTVMPGGPDLCYPASRRSLFARVPVHGCALSELPAGMPPRRYSDLTRRRLVAAIAPLTVVVEAEARASALVEAHTARELDRPVAAIPGRICSPLAAGPNALLADGARLVRSAQDVLDVLYGVGMQYGNAQAARRPGEHQSDERQPDDRDRPNNRQPDARRSHGYLLDANLRLTLEEVRAGRDTVTKLTAAGARARDVVVALAELELLGKLVRGDGGRYVCPVDAPQPPRSGAPPSIVTPSRGCSSVG
jgi:DNA processing protein